MYEYDDYDPLSDENLTRLARQVIREDREGTTPPDPEPGPPTSAKVELSDHQIGVQLLLEASDGDHEKAFDVLGDDPTILERLEPRIKERRSQLEAQALEQAVAEWNASPEGRHIRAKAVAEDRAERKRMAIYARELLLEEGEFAELASTISDDEAIELAGLAPKPEPDADHYQLPEKTEHDQAVEKLSQTWWTLAAHQRVEACEELGIDYAEMQSKKEASPSIYG